MAAMLSIAIIGGGFSGSLLAVHLLRRCPGHVRVHLIERNEKFGRGLAYSTGNAGHLLNVPAGKMSAFQDDPEHFLTWLRSHDAELAAFGITAAGVDPASFVPRGAFGAYVQHLLGGRLWQDGGNRNLYLVPDEAVTVAETQTFNSV